MSALDLEVYEDERFALLGGSVPEAPEIAVHVDPDEKDERIDWRSVDLAAMEAAYAERAELAAILRWRERSAWRRALEPLVVICLVILGGLLWAAVCTATL